MIHLRNVEFLASLSANSGGGGDVGLKRDLVSYWNLDEPGPGTRADSRLVHSLADKTSSLGGTTGIIINCAGHFGQTADTAALWTPSNSDFQAGPGKSFTITLWSFPAGSGNNTRNMLGKWGAAGKEYLIFALDHGSGFTYVQAQFFENGTTQKDCDPTGDAHFQNFASAWAFYAFGYDAVNQLAFLKSVRTGVVYTVSVACSNIDGTTSDFVVGNNSDYTSAHWGWLDEVGFWKRVLTDDELIQIQNNDVGLPFSSF